MPSSIQSFGAAVAAPLVSYIALAFGWRTAFMALGFPGLLLALAVLFVPIFFVVVRSVFKGSERQHQFDAEHGHQIGVDRHE